MYLSSTSNPISFNLPCMGCREEEGAGNYPSALISMGTGIERSAEWEIIHLH